jgi:hypothetical protein
MAASAATPSPTKRPILPEPDVRPVVVVAVRGTVATAAAMGTCGSDVAAIVGALATASGTGGMLRAGIGSVIPRIGSRRRAWRSAFQNSPADCQREVGLMATACAKTASTSSLTAAPSVRGVGLRSVLAAATASCRKSSPSRGSLPERSSAMMSARENTSVHGPVAPCVRENCSGAPYAGVKLVTCPLVLLNEPAIFCASVTTFAMPKSSSFTVQSPRGSPRTKTFPGLMSRCAMPLRCASASASAAGSSNRTASTTVRGESLRVFSSSITASSVAPSSHSRTM